MNDLIGQAMRERLVKVLEELNAKTPTKRELIAGMVYASIASDGRAHAPWNHEELAAVSVQSADAIIAAAVER